MSESRIYLDNAATSWPKPDSVYDAVDHYMRCSGVPYGRNASDRGLKVTQSFENCRNQILQLISGKAAGNLLFTGNGTQSLNIVLSGWLRDGDHVITSDAEHNSLLRPLNHLQKERGIKVTCLPCESSGAISVDGLASAIQSNTRLIALIHTSNVSSASLPLSRVCEIAKSKGVPLLLDAAQSLGHLPINVEELNIDFLAAPGHKALGGPLGTGVLYVSHRAIDELVSQQQGGTGTVSESDLQPESAPEKFESGNLNVPGVIGLEKGVEYLLSLSQKEIELPKKLAWKLYQAIREIEGAVVYGPENDSERGAITSFNLEGFDPQEVTSILDSTFQTEVRSGFHCAPRIHAALGCEKAGCVRLSPGFFNTEDQIDIVIDAIKEIASA